MGYTGYKAIQYIDENPLSPTYMETTIEYVLDSDNCPSGDGEWVLVSSECEAVTSGYTGRRINIYYNDATNEYSSVTVSDSSCNASSNEELWVDSGNTYCEVDEDGLYTGRGAKIQVQRNSNLLNYGETREVTFYDASCLIHLDPIWQDLSKNCHIEVTVSGQLYYDGTADILQIDINPSSELYNTTRTINVPDEDCISIVCDSIEDEWKFVDDYCGNQVPANYNLFNLTADTIYHIYRKYEKCIVDGEVVRETPTNEFSAVTYQTGVSDCMYRWVDTEETVCQESIDLKFKATYSGGTTYSAECDSSTSLTTATTKPSGYTYSAMTSAIIGSCITSIGDEAFASCSSLSSIDIPNGVTSIGLNAFQSCSGLTSVSIPNSVTSISGGAFSFCSGLTSVSIGSGVTSIELSTFAFCISLSSCTIGSGVTSIGGNAFYDCKSLSNIVIPNSVTSIGDNAFAGCSGLTSIDIPSGVTSIGKMVFTDCSGLTSIDIPSGVTNICNSAFRNCSSLASIDMPNGVTSIGQYAFQYCRSFTSINIPNSVTSIGNEAFYGCRSLTSITCLPTTPPALEANVFGNTNNCPIYVPSGSVNAYKSASGWSNYSSRITAIS